MSKSDDLIRLVGILEDAPVEGMSIDDIQKITLASDDHWSYRTINALLCDLGSRVTHEKVRIKTGKVTRYKLRGL